MKKGLISYVVYSNAITNLIFIFLISAARRKIKMWYNRKEKKRFLRKLREDVVSCLIVFVGLIGSLMMFEFLI